MTRRIAEDSFDPDHGLTQEQMLRVITQIMQPREAVHESEILRILKEIQGSISVQGALMNFVVRGRVSLAWDHENDELLYSRYQRTRGRFMRRPIQPPPSFSREEILEALDALRKAGRPGAFRKLLRRSRRKSVLPSFRTRKTRQRRSRALR